MKHPIEENGPEAEYQVLMQAGELKPDADQARAVASLERLHRELIDYPAIDNQSNRFSFKNWWPTGLFRWSGSDKPAPKGIYLYGGVGRGKSMLMDLFYSVAPTTFKRRVHFHEFMLDIHARLKEAHDLSAQKRMQRGGRASDADPIPVIARQIANEATLLCFDELQVTDIADAMVLTRLFNALFEQGVIVVATSNRPPDDLYKHGLNRHRFLPFIEQIKERLELIPLEGSVDYRYNRLKGAETYYFPINEETTAQLSATFFRLTDRRVEDRAKVPSETLAVQGRTLFVPKAARGVAVFSFKRLCANPLGPADYLAIARTYHTVIMVAIPQFTRENSDQAKRFITFIDALYEHNVKFLCSAAVPPQSLYAGGEISFEFERTISRLMEMQSEDYLTRGHGKIVAD
ncbi:cell division protein ZapE [Nitrosomonas sp. Is37]|uniref:cell division protein ZapE n=1 Tax=Nitrosomonas sp. Is37 TaxID=3080535 RepID=UPI00294B00AB|nr:cell division protein ZapE [Nitrosomonas sp. Is37]MDV6344917.1 cell division protein ZapE [Nitrosomonas sp. Is37]